jgi:hypothetical protein
MAITNDQVKDVEKLRADVHSLISKGLTDEYLLATYNGIVRRLDDRLPRIRQRAEGKTLKEETRELVRKQREAVRNKSGQATATPASSSKKSA